jgi:hypothetical protein
MFRYLLKINHKTRKRHLLHALHRSLDSAVEQNDFQRGEELALTGSHG